MVKKKKTAHRTVLWGVLLSVVVITLGVISFLAEETSPTSFVEGSFAQKIASVPVIVREHTAQAVAALFDIHLSILPESKIVEQGEALLVSVELRNLGQPGKVSVNLNYIITNEEGSVVYIEHETKEVETQDTFLKEIVLPKLSYGKYKLLVELLYSDTSAVAQEEFRVV